ncbi:MAG: outer membrane beta-barrel protein [Flavihumibacter sp.]|nr:outer membrane beta-barrel protein [Flavihumibacter sp.]
MQPTENNKMDQLGRDAAENYQAPVAPNWDKFLPQLDEAMPQKEKKRRRFLLFWLLLGLTVGGAGTYIALKPSGNTQVANTPATNNSTTLATQPTKRFLKEEAGAQQQPSTASTKNTGSSKNVVPDTYTDTELSPNTKISSKNAVTENGLKNNNTQSITITTLNTPQQKKKRTGTTYQSSPVKNKPEVIANATPKNTASVLPNSTRVDDKNIIPVPSNTVPQAESNSSNTTTAPIATIATDTSSTNTNTVTITSPVASTIVDSGKTITPTKKPVQKTKEKNTFSLAITSGVDWSTVKYDYTEPLGINIGLMGGYHLNKHWSLHTGLIYTHKKYEAKGQYFSPKDNNPWYATIKMMHMDGYCNMWEWPVYARYVFNPVKKHPVFISTGISSYRMNKENYHYTYTYNTSTTVYHKNAVKTNKDIYLASILHLSAGTSFKAGKKLSILAEPYAKLPLRKMGYGSLMLSSFGVNFSLQLKQPQKK